MTEDMTSDTEGDELPDIAIAFYFGVRAMSAVIEAAGDGETFEPLPRCWAMVRDVAAGELTIAPNVQEWMAQNPDVLPNAQASGVVDAANRIVRADRRLAHRLLDQERERRRARGVTWDPFE